MKPAMPTRLFRFFPVGAKGFLDEKKIWFSNILDFNDPFDATPSPAEIICEGFQSRSHETFGSQPIPESLQQKIDNGKARSALVLARFIQERFGECFGVVCFTAKNDFIPMWAHYASKHEGFAMEFNPAHPFFNDEQFGIVHYDPKRPQLPTTTNQPEEETRKLAFTKSIQWDDGAEWRLIKTWSDLTPGQRPWDNKPSRYLALPPDAIRAIHFGCRVTRDVTDAIEMSCKKSEYRDVKLFQMIPDPTDYKLKEVTWAGHKSIIPDEERPTLQTLWRIFSDGYNVP
jgi:hypothetical protein